MRITSCGGRGARKELKATESRGWGQGRAGCFSEALNERKRVSGPGVCALVPFQRPLFPVPPHPHPVLQHLRGREGCERGWLQEVRGRTSLAELMSGVGSVQGFCCHHLPGGELLGLVLFTCALPRQPLESPWLLATPILRRGAEPFSSPPPSTRSVLVGRTRDWPAA